MNNLLNSKQKKIFNIAKRILKILMKSEKYSIVSTSVIRYTTNMNKIPGKSA